MPQTPSPPPANPQKTRTGLRRLWYAAGFSLQGLRAGWNEKAFRTETLIAACLLPLVPWLGRSWSECILLVAVIVLVLLIELLNSAIESAIDRIGPEWHALSKRAKDMGSAAVLLAMLLCAGTWLSALYLKFNP